MRLRSPLAGRARDLAIIRACSRVGAYNLMETFVADPRITLAAVEKQLQGRTPLKAKPEAKRQPASPEPTGHARDLAILGACTEAGLPDLAESLLTMAGGTLPMASVREILDANKKHLADTKAHAVSIQTMCKMVGLEPLAAGLIRWRVPLSEAKNYLLITSAYIDRERGEIDGHLAPAEGRTR